MLVSYFPCIEDWVNNKTNLQIRTNTKQNEMKNWSESITKQIYKWDPIQSKMKWITDLNQ